MKEFPIYFGGIASAMASCCTHPLDLLKVRMQSATDTRPTLVHSLTTIVRQESVLGLFNGLSASIMRQLTYSTVRFALYERIKMYYTRSGQDFSPMNTICAGVVAGAVSGVAGNPADVVNVRMQSDTLLPVEKRRAYKHAVDGIIKIVRLEGFGALFRGLDANVNRAMLMTASQLGSYDIFKSRLLRSSNFRDDIYTHFLASLFAGLVATTVSSPVDVAKTRIMNASSQSGSQKSLIVTLASMVRNEGVRSLFKGWLPAFSRLGPQTVLTFIFLEKLRTIYIQGTH